MKYIGIDLGTTNTVAAVGAEVLELSSKQCHLLPSVVAFPPSGAVLVGQDAQRRRPIDPKNTIFSAKRIIGRNWTSSDTKEFLSRYDFDLVEENNIPKFKTRMGLVSAVDIAQQILNTLGDLPKTELSNAVGVITVPSLFKEAERTATIEAGKKAGLADIKLLDEPVATALAYLSRKTERINYAAVYDLGGGTFDLAILDCSQRPIKILAHGGDLYLGGDDIDRGIADWAVETVLKQHHWDLKSDLSVFSRLVVECEQTKIRLCEHEETIIDLTRVDPASPLAQTELKINRSLLSKLCMQLVQKSFILCDQILRQARVNPQKIDALFVAGGSTLLPMVREGIQVYFGKPVVYTFNPMYTVAIGASLSADFLKA